MSFIESRLLDSIPMSYGLVGGPEFSTGVSVSTNGRERRNINWSRALNRYIVKLDFSEKHLEQLISAFRICQGRANGFRFKDPYDYKIVNQEIGIGDGVKKDFQVIKNYSIAGISNSYKRNVIKISSNNFSVSVNGLAIAIADYKAYDKTGIITFNNPPNAGESISVNCEFDVPVRFNTDWCNINYSDVDRKEIKFELIEIR